MHSLNEIDRMNDLIKYYYNLLTCNECHESTMIKNNDNNIQQQFAIEIAPKVQFNFPISPSLYRGRGVDRERGSHREKER